MRNVKRNFATAAVALLALLFLTGGSSAQKAETAPQKAKRYHVMAQAYGQGTQLGRTIGVDLYVKEFSTAEDQQALLEAFQAKGNEGLINALSKMKTKGRMSVTGTLGYDVSYIRKFPQPDGSVKVRMVTNRPLRFGEAWADSRSSDYSLSGVELIISPNKKKNSGTLLPACKFKIDKQGQLEIELLQNAWRLSNVRVS